MRDLRAPAGTSGARYALAAVAVVESDAGVDPDTLEDRIREGVGEVSNPMAVGKHRGR